MSISHLFSSCLSFILQGEGWITRQAAGLSFDFVPNDPSTYVTGK